MPTSRESALIAARAAHQKKATDIIVQDVGETMRLVDYFVIVTGANHRQVDAICEAVEESLRLEAGIKPIGREGLDDMTWVLLDYGDLIVHVFQPELRDFYRLETLWSDSPLIDLSEIEIDIADYSERVAKLLNPTIGGPQGQG